MLDSDEKKRLLARMRRIEGQVRAIQRMIEEDSYCVDTLHQIAAAQAALGKAGQLILSSHIESCVAESFKSGSERDRTKKIEELMDVFGRYARLGS